MNKKKKAQAASLLELLDAQNAALVADQLVATAMHDFLLDYLQLQRSVGRLGGLEDDAELVVELEAYLAD